MKIPSNARTATYSLILDWALITRVKMSGTLKFIFHKYLLICFPFLYYNHTLRAYAFPIHSRYAYIPNTRHIGFLQSVFTDHVFLRRYIPQNATIIDIGAHIGEFNLMASIFLQASHVISIEPASEAYRLLKANTTQSTYHYAICPESETIMHIPPMTVMASKYPMSGQYATEHVPCIQLDSIPEIQQLSHIDLLKIDVEGMEYDVLLTCQRTIMKSSYLLVEISLKRPSSASGMEILSFIHTIAPQANIAHIGHIHPSTRDLTQTAVDVLFQI